MYERPRVNVKVERGSTFTLRVDRSYIASKPALTASILFTRVHTEKNYATVVIHLNTRYVNTRVW